jgi:hypothetical protein
MFRAAPVFAVFRRTTGRPARRGVLGLVLGVAAGFLTPPPVAAQAPTRSVTVGQYQISLLGEYLLPSATTFGGTLLGGLSSLDYDARTGRYVAISDDRGNDRPASGPARYYTLGVDVGESGIRGVTVEGVTTLRRPDGTPFPDGTLDPEGMRLAPDGTLYWSSEGRRTDALREDPFVRRTDAAGNHLGQFELRDYFRTTPLGNAASGVADNFGFESLALSADGRRVYTVNENALLQDGPRATPERGAPVRFVEYDAATGRALAERVYVTDPAADAPRPGGAIFSGVVEAMAFDDDQFLVLERSFSVGPDRHEIRLFLTSLAGATDVLGTPSLVGAAYTPMAKSLFLDFDAFGPYQVPLTNIEGVTFGPRLANGDRTLLLVGDNNFGGGTPTQFIALRVATIPEPGTVALVAAGLVGVAVAARRRSRGASRG